MKIRQHIPGFVTGFEPATLEFETIEQLMSAKWVKRWTAHEGFRNFAISPDDNHPKLMAEFGDNRVEKWYVIGFLEGNWETLDIPPAADYMQIMREHPEPSCKTVTLTLTEEQKKNRTRAIQNIIKGSMSVWGDAYSGLEAADETDLFSKR